MTTTTKEYHVFADKIDDWFTDYDKAVAFYLKLIKEGQPNVRLYEEIRDEQGECISEDCLMAFGGFPW